MQHGFTYAGARAASARVTWRIEDLIGAGRQLDFSRPFMPERLARTAPLSFLSPRERLLLNHIRGHGYLALFGLVEEFILPFVMDHARARLDGDDEKARALLQFAGEEAKHIHLFKRFRDEFEAGFGVECKVIGPPQAVAEAVLQRHPLGVALAILQIEWMTQAHYLESVQKDEGLDAQFKSLLKHHWVEEAQHAMLDTLMVEALAARREPDEVAHAVDEYLAIVDFLDAGLGQQAALDMEGLERAAGRTLGAGERTRFKSVQHQALRWTFLGSGMTHPKFLATLGAVSAPARERVERLARAFC